MNAEDPSRDFLPAPGTLERFRPPLGPGVRVDSSVTEGATITPHYDSLLAKLIVWDVDRPAAVARALRALAEFEVAGVPTTIPAARDILRSEEFPVGTLLDDLPRRGGRASAGARGDPLMAGRRAARRAALFMLYQWDVTGEPLEPPHEGEVDPFAVETAEAVAARAPELDRRITEAAEGWTADRLGAVERNVLRIGGLRARGRLGAGGGGDRRGGAARQALCL